MQQLTSIEIAKLFDFVKSKNVPHIDVQFEIVDHLATEIESMISQNPNLNFDSALEEINYSMPLTGFWKIQLEKQKSLKRFWTRRIFKYFSSYLTLPKIIVSIFMYLLFKSLFEFTGTTGIIVVSIVFLVIFEALYINWSNSDSLNSDKYLVSNSLKKVWRSTVYLFSWFPFILFWEFGLKDGQLLNYSIPFISVAFVLLVLISYATYFVFPKMLENELNLKYQHLRLQ